MPFDTPPLRVSRPIAACAPCRRTKSKCDGKLPVCSSCEKSGKAEQCVSNNTDTRETSYVATLETRKALLEKAYAESRMRRRSVIGAVEAPDVVSLSSRPPAPEKPESRKRINGRKEAGDVNDLVGDFGLMSISATSRDFYGFTPETSYARFVVCSSARGHLPAAGANVSSMPKREDASRMFQEVFARNLNCLPVLAESEIWIALNRVYTDSSAKPFDHFVVNVLLAIYAAQSNVGRNGTSSASTTHLSNAMAFAPQVLRPGSVTSIQALLLLAVHAYLDPAYFDNWSLVGFATRAMVDIGMHHDPLKSSSMPKQELDLRRRVFWCVYTLDRLASMAHRRPFSFSDDSTGVGLPSNASCTQGAIALFKLRQMQSQFYSSLYQPSSAPSYDGPQDPWAYVWRMQGKLGDWLQQALHHAEPAMAVTLELEYSASCAFLLASSPRCPAPDTHALSLRQQHSSRFAALAQQARGLFSLEALGTMAG